MLASDERALTVRMLAEAWLAKRDTETAEDDRGRLYNHILLVIGDIPVKELRPRRIRDLVEAQARNFRKGLDPSVRPRRPRQLPARCRWLPSAPTSGACSAPPLDPLGCNSKISATTRDLAGHTPARAPQLNNSG